MTRLGAEQNTNRPFWDRQTIGDLRRRLALLRWYSWRIAGILMAIAALVRLPEEVSYWLLASAKNAFEAGDFDRAIDRSTRGMFWTTDRTELLAIRGMARFAQQDSVGCLQDFDEIVANAAKDSVDDKRDWDAVERKANMLLRMKRFDECIALWNQIVQRRKEHYENYPDPELGMTYAMSLNNRAYMQALARVRLHEALADMEQAMALLRELIGPDHADPVVWDTLGYLLLLNEQPEQASYYLERAVRLMEATNRIQTDLLRQRVASESQLAQIRKEIEKQYSIVLHHRGEAYLAAGDAEKGMLDIGRARQLGYNPDEGIW